MRNADQKEREKTDGRVPALKAQRDRVQEAARGYVQAHRLTGPLTILQLREHSQQVLAECGFDGAWLDFAAVVLNNEIWRPTVLKIPFARRLLLLPQCLRDAAHCPAEFDSLGLLCKHCGRCVIDRFVADAEALGYAVLVAEGSPVVMAMIESGQIEAVIGVSCLSVLERVFPYMEAGAVPGVAIPLLREGCRDTAFDTDWLEEVLWVCEEGGGTVNPELLKSVVREWFEEERLREVLGSDGDPTARAALEWMALEGKRWRPVLTVGTWAALSGRGPEEAPPEVRQTATAVECFHKASLIHDDIEDEDPLRYERPTLHEKYGVAFALNAGDFLIGEGYRLIGGLAIDPARKAAMLQTAAKGHRTLCIGQGMELERMRRGTLPATEEMIEIFARKTAPAFEVALNLGALLAGENTQEAVFEAYSRTLGIAYQIRDDLQDWRAVGQTGHVRPFSIVTAAAMEKAGADDRVFLESIAACRVTETGLVQRYVEIIRRTRAEEMLSERLEDFRMQALDLLGRIDESSLKIFLRRVVSKLFDDIQRMGCCDELGRPSRE
jgi:geranylgeranyl diphosphate synthase type II